MSKLDYERPQYEWERVRPDQVDEDVMVSFMNRAGIGDAALFIQHAGKKWTVWEDRDTENPVYATIYPVNDLSLSHKAKMYKVVIGFYFGRYRFERVVDSWFPGLPFHFDANGKIHVFYKANYKYEFKLYKEIISIKEYMKDIYYPLIKLLIERKILKVK